ncbi:hypothetical protein AURDEDRAFT_112702 [Auricularia subglabra TFB-10046 SS5]|nr:hypothetical protein AURDEDRAFT_112702 [Auricularia subglabra TFB-10046 SS5]
MAETLVAILFVTSSGRGKTVSFWWPERPKRLPRLSRPRPDPREAYTAHKTDVQWRAAFSPDFDRQIGRDATQLYSPDDEDSYEWQPPTFVRRQSTSQARSSSTGRDSPHVDRSFDRSHIGDEPVHNDGVLTPLVLGYPLNALAALLAPVALCHQKFELLVDELVFLGHPVCRDADGSWPPVPTPGSAPNTDVRAGNNSDGIAHSHSLHMFHIVFVLDRPDPSSASTGNLARYYDALYRQVAFKLTAALYLQQSVSGFVDNECDYLEDLKSHLLMRDPYDNTSGAYNAAIKSFMEAAKTTSSIASGLMKTFDAIKNKALVDVVVGDIHVQIQLPPFLDALLHDPDDIDYPSDDEDDNTWGAESIGWRLPPFTRWKSLLLMKDDSELEIIEDLGQSGTFEGDIKSEEMLEFLDHTSPHLTFNEIHDLLAWQHWEKLWSIVRILIANRKAMIIDPIHQSLKATYVPIPGSTMSNQLIMEFEHHFVNEPEIPRLPALLSDISQNPRETFAGALGVQRERVPAWMHVLKWLIRKRVVVRLHTRVRIRVPAHIKESVRTEQAERRLAREREKARHGAGSGLGLGKPVERRGRKRTRDATVSWDSSVEDEGNGPELPYARMDSVEVGVDDDDADGFDWQDEDDNLLPSVIPTPQKATALQRMWLESMTHGKDPRMAELFKRLADHFDGTITEDEIMQINSDENITRQQFREMLQHFKEYLIISMHP